jgi:hypothetical protein
MRNDYRSVRHVLRLASVRTREEVIDVEIVIVESEADQIDPELVRHVP